MDDIKIATRWRQWSNRLLELIPCTCLICQGSAPTLLCDGCKLNLVHPPNCCARCGEPLPAAENNPAICGSCLAHPPPFDRTLFAASYDEQLGGLIRQFKYSGKLIIARALSDLVIESLSTRYHAEPIPDVLVPVPLHPARLRERGFNQSLEIARRIGTGLEIPVAHRLVRRTRDTNSQTGLSRKDRDKNIQGAFGLYPRRGKQFAGKHIAIVDDVVTTGATARELAKLLMRLKPAKISLVCVAKTSAT